MYRVFPALIPRAAAVRAQCLELGGRTDYNASSSAPSSSTLVAAAPSATNVYTLAFGEREGLAPGERLEVYGNTVRLTRTLAYGCPRGVTAESAYTGRLTGAELAAITEQLEELRRRSRVSRQPAAAVGVPPRELCLRVPEVTRSRVLVSAVPEEAAARTGKGLAAQLAQLHSSEEEVVVAEWVDVDEGEGAADRADGEAAWSPRPDSTTARSERLSSSSSAATAAAAAAGATASSTPPRKSGVSPPQQQQQPDASGALLLENGVCFGSADACGLRALRTARLAFISSIERTANSHARRPRRHAGEEDARGLAVLDASAIDFTFTQAALQSTLELGLHTSAGAGCHITHVPLTDAAAARLDAQAAGFVRVVAAGPGRALSRPFEHLPAYAVDVGAYTAWLPLPVGAPPHETAAEDTRRPPRTGGQTASRLAAAAEAVRRRRQVERTDVRAERHQLAVQLSQALAMLRRGACMLVTFVPKCSSVAALYHETQTQRRAEVLVEHTVVTEAKACIAEAIARTGRWGCITDEVLPAVDSAQGSSFSLVVMLE
ncbi:hypothetical protein NESM_000067100 [Novymonas esmeraldas]|uniref:Uncharacterized protein n=1 Tax=Novymonas esmeraldas TaxID=1808958 RepID=A0AAW0F3F8_9TRYP